MSAGYRVEKWQKLFSPDPSRLRHSMTVEGYNVFQWSDEPGVEYDSHMHSEDQSHWIISGSLELSVKDAGVFILDAGDRDFMPAGTYHSARVLGESPVTYLIGAKH